MELQLHRHTILWCLWMYSIMDLCSSGGKYFVNTSINNSNYKLFQQENRLPNTLSPHAWLVFTFTFGNTHHPFSDRQTTMTDF